MKTLHRWQYRSNDTLKYSTKSILSDPLRSCNKPGKIVNKHQEKFVRLLDNIAYTPLFDTPKYTPMLPFPKNLIYNRIDMKFHNEKYRPFLLYFCN